MKDVLMTATASFTKKFTVQLQTQRTQIIWRVKSTQLNTKETLKRFQFVKVVRVFTSTVHAQRSSTCFFFLAFMVILLTL